MEKAREFQKTIYFCFIDYAKAFDCVKWSELAQSCLTLCDNMDCSLPGSSVHGIFQARILEWVSISFSRGTSRPRNWNQVSLILGRRFTIWATREAVWITTNWKILKQKGIPDHLTWLLRNLYAGLEATLITGHGTTVWFQIGKGVHQGCILSPCLFNLYAMQSTSWEMLGWRKHKLESRLPGEISITSDMQMTPPLWQKVKKN